MDVKPLPWAPEQVQNFWDYWSSRSDSQATYFAAQVGEGVCAFVDLIGNLAGREVLDYGSGPGFLVTPLLRRGARVSAVDYSPQTVAELNRRFAQHENWCGGACFQEQTLPWPDASFDCVFCLETIEHLLPEHLTLVLAELLRVLKPDGQLICTTPNTENLQTQMVYCPHCQHEFHRWQHVRSWTPQSLQHCLQESGFRVEFCAGVNFHDFQPRPARRSDLWRPRLWKRRVRNAFRTVADQLWPRPFPHGRRLQAHLIGSTRHHLAAVAAKPSKSVTLPVRSRSIAA